MTIKNPAQFVNEFKKSGEFDRLRRELLSQFQKGDDIESFMARVEDIARQRINADQKLQYMPPEAVHRELMQEIDRYPLVERAVTDVSMISDPGFAANIRRSVTKILRQDRGEPLDDEPGSPEAMDIDEPSDDETPIHVTNVTSHQMNSQPSLTEKEATPSNKPSPVQDAHAGGSHSLADGTVRGSGSAEVDSVSQMTAPGGSPHNNVLSVDGFDSPKEKYKEGPARPSVEVANVSSSSGTQFANVPDVAHSNSSPTVQTSDSNVLHDAPVPDHNVPRDADAPHAIQEAESA
ncbi:hypothetical protein OE88DRAFT_1804906 [Heliocybe sulcata]|uniref:BOD1/SHG1 domain-containing protein n=1 Tax=Heliocybe sulcata TaxID=5364 RepID=A0A5C3NE03_9AGAM|nr:hypothetical protein OE88DRAFT_1804906 [Heliocybe sulcata]